jgi:hypothetical protein
LSNVFEERAKQWWVCQQMCNVVKEDYL